MPDTPFLKNADLAIPAVKIAIAGKYPTGDHYKHAFLESIRSGHSVAIKQGDKITGWLCPVEFQPLLESLGYRSNRGLMELHSQDAEEAGKLKS